MHHICVIGKRIIIKVFERNIKKISKVRFTHKFSNLHYVVLSEYPKTIKEWGERSNFKRVCKNLPIENGQFLYKRQCVVVMEKQQQLGKIKDVCEGVGQRTHSKATASDVVRASTYSKISERFFWYLI